MSISKLIGFCNLLVGGVLFYHSEFLRSLVAAHELPSIQAIKLFAISYALIGVVALFAGLWGFTSRQVRSILLCFHGPIPILLAIVPFVNDWNALSVVYLGGPSLIWWMPLLLEYCVEDAESDGRKVVVASWLLTGEAQQVKEALLASSNDGSIVVVFLRHFGCVFCKELLNSLKVHRKAIESSGAKLVLVHLLEDAEGKSHLSDLGFEDVDSISDPFCELYKSFGVRKTSVFELISVPVLGRFISLIFKGYKPGPVQGDPMQLSGVIVINNGEVVRSYLQRRSSDQTDFSICFTSES